MASGLCPLPSLCVVRGVCEVTCVPMRMAEWQALTWEESSTPALAGCLLLPEFYPGADKDVGSSAGGLSPPFSRPPRVEGLSLLQMLTPRGGPSTLLCAGGGRGPAGDHRVGQANLPCDFKTRLEWLSIASFLWFFRKSDPIVSFLKSGRNPALRCLTWPLRSRITLT